MYYTTSGKKVYSYQEKTESYLRDLFESINGLYSVFINKKT